MSEWVDEHAEPDPELNALTDAIIGSAIAVHKEIGPGLPEMTYANAVALEFTARNIPFLREHPFSIFYRGQLVGEGRLDFLVADRVIVELKAVETLGALHTAQVITYLLATKLKLAILINFNVRLLKDGIKRIAN